MVFGVSQLNNASQIWLSQTLVAMVTKICDFQHKIYYNLACVGDTAQMHARNRGFSRSANLMVSVKLCSDDPCWHGNENLPNFYRKLLNRSRDFAHAHKLIYGYYHSAVRYDVIDS